MDIYYMMRADDARVVAQNARTERVAALHKELAERYEALAQATKPQTNDIGASNEL